MPYVAPAPKYYINNTEYTQDSNGRWGMNVGYKRVMLPENYVSQLRRVDPIPPTQAELTRIESIDRIYDQITNQRNTLGTGKYWTGEGFGSVDANTRHMAEGLVNSGITDINQVGRGQIMTEAWLKPIYTTPNGYTAQQSLQDGKYYSYSGPAYDYYDETGQYHSEPSRVEVKPSDLKLMGYTAVGVAEEGQGDPTISVAEAKNLRTDANGNIFGTIPSGRTGIINKDTGKPLVSEYGERAVGNMWSGTYSGSGNTGYGVQFDSKGNPIFYTQGSSSSDVGAITPILAIASIIPSPIQPFAIAANAAIAASQGDILGAVAAVAGLAGMSEVASVARIAKAAESGDLVGVISGVAGVSGMTSIPGTGITAQQVSSGLKAAQALESGDFVNGILSAAGAAGVTNIAGMDLADVTKTINVVQAVESGDPLKIAKAVSKLNLPTSQAPYATEAEVQARTDEIIKGWETQGETEIAGMLTASGLDGGFVGPILEAVSNNTGLPVDQVATAPPSQIAENIVEKPPASIADATLDKLLSGEGGTLDGMTPEELAAIVNPPAGIVDDATELAAAGTGTASDAGQAGIPRWLSLSDNETVTGVTRAVEDGIPYERVEVTRANPNDPTQSTSYSAIRYLDTGAIEYETFQPDVGGYGGTLTSSKTKPAESWAEPAEEATGGVRTGTGEAIRTGDGTEVRTGGGGAGSGELGLGEAEADTADVDARTQEILDALGQDTLSGGQRQPSFADFEENKIDPITGEVLPAEVDQVGPRQQEQIPEEQLPTKQPQDITSGFFGVDDLLEPNVWRDDLGNKIDPLTGEIVSDSAAQFGPVQQGVSSDAGDNIDAGGGWSPGGGEAEAGAVAECAPGFHNENGLCVADEDDSTTAIPTCPEGYIYDLVEGACVSAAAPPPPAPPPPAPPPPSPSPPPSPVKKPSPAPAPSDLQQLLQTISPSRETISPIYQEAAEYMRFGEPLDVNPFKAKPKKQDVANQQQTTKIATGGYLEDLSGYDMSVDDLLKLLR